MRKYLILLVLFISSCGYSFSSTNSVVKPQDKVWVAFLTNETTSTSAQTLLRRAVLDELHTMRGVTQASSKEDADIVITGAVRGYGSGISAFDKLDQVREYRLNVSAEFEAKRKNETKPIWRGVISSTQDYPISDNLALQRNSEDEALRIVSKKIAVRLVSALENNY